MVTIAAFDRYDMPALIEARKALEACAASVRVTFASGDPDVVLTKADLPRLYRKLIYTC